MLMDINSASSLKQQSAGRHVTSSLKQQSAGRHVTSSLKQQSAGRHVTPCYTNRGSNPQSRQAR